MAVYVDVLLCLNFLLDYLLLAGVQLLRKRQLRRGRLAWGALLGAGGSLSLFIPAIQGQPLLRLLLSAAMTAIAEGRRGWKSFLRSWLLLFVLSFLAGGVLLYAMNRGRGIFYDSGVFYAHVQPLTLVAAMTMGFGAIQLYQRLFPEREAQSLTCPAELWLLGERVSCSAFLDTGNQLREPFSGWPVVVLERSRFPGNIPDEKQRLIPCQTIQGQSLLPAVKGQRLLLHTETPRELERFYVAFSQEKLGAGLIVCNE